MQYIATEYLMKLCWFLFGTASNFITACKRQQKGELNLELPTGYTVCSLYHRNIMEFEHSCGEHFCINSDGFMNGWQCPACDTAMPLQLQYEKIVKWSGRGEYTVEGTFKGMEQPIAIRHKCGRIINRSARAFLYDGTRCICESKRTFEEMQAKIQSCGDYELLRYNPKTEQVTIRHNICGREFSISYLKFLKVPACKACRPRVRNEETFRCEIQKLVGDEYELVSSYCNKDTKVTLRHTICGSEQEYKVAHFLRGQRCSKCSRNIPLARFSEIVSEQSCGRYKFVRMATNNQALLKDTETEKEIRMERHYTLQELFRSTPSEVLPCEHPEITTPLQMRKSEHFLQWLCGTYAKDAEMTLADMAGRSQLTYAEVKRITQSLKENGFIVWIRRGTYCFPEHAAAKQVDGTPVTKLDMLWNWIQESYANGEIITIAALKEHSNDYLSYATLKQIINRMKKQGLLVTVERGKYVRGDTEVAKSCVE